MRRVAPVCRLLKHFEQQRLANKWLYRHERVCECRDVCARGKYQDTACDILGREAGSTQPVTLREPTFFFKKRTKK